MKTINGTKNPILKTLKDGDIVMIEVSDYKQIVKLKNIQYKPLNKKFDSDWLEFDSEVLFTNTRMHKNNMTALGNCLAITQIIPNEIVENIASQNKMWKADMYLLSDEEVELMTRRFL